MLTLPISPRLRMLQQALQQGAADALPAFWYMIARNGTPLVEPIADEPDSSLVSFLWCATLYYSEFAGGHECICWRGSLADGLYALLNGTDNRASDTGQAE